VPDAAGHRAKMKPTVYAYSRSNGRRRFLPEYDLLVKENMREAAARKFFSCPNGPKARKSFFQRVNYRLF